MRMAVKGCIPLHDDVIEIILAFLSITDIPSASLVCKQWRSFITSSPLLRSLSNSIHKPKPWLFLLGPNKTTGLGFDPVARRWIHLPPFNFNSSAEDAIMEGNGFLFSVAGGRLSWSCSFLNPRKWYETAVPMRVWRQHPVVSYDYRGNKIFVIGGVFEFEENPLCVEAFDMKSGAWEMCDPLPDHFKDTASSTWLSSVAFNGKIYVLEKYRGDLCCYDLRSKRWGNVKKVRPQPSSSSGGWVRYNLMACRSDLVLTRLVKEEEEGNMNMSIWKVDESSMECMVDTERRMPCEMVNNLVRGKEKEDLLCGEEMECRGAGDIIYVLGNWRFKERRCVCLFDMSRNLWEMAGEIDDSGFGMKGCGRIKFVCSSVTLDETSFTINEEGETGQKTLFPS